MKDNERDNKYVERPAKLSLYQDRIDYLKVIPEFFMYNKRSKYVYNKKHSKIPNNFMPN